MVDPSVILVLIALVVFAFSVLMLTKICECAHDNNNNNERRTERVPPRSDSTIYIIEENGDVLAIHNNGEGEIDKYDVKHSYDNLAPPPYFALIEVQAESSYEFPPPYPIGLS